MKKTEVITARGHALIRSSHKTTLEITKDNSLTERGHCIVAVGSDKAIMDLSRDFKEAARLPDAEITITIEAGGEEETVTAKGDPRLSFTHPTDIVVRKSSYVCSRTLAVKADKAAADLSRKVVKKLQNPGEKIRIILTVRTPNKIGIRQASESGHPQLPAIWTEQPRGRFSLRGTFQHCAPLYSRFQSASS